MCFVYVLLYIFFCMCSLFHLGLSSRVKPTTRKASTSKTNSNFPLGVVTPTREHTDAHTRMLVDDHIP